MTKTSKTIENRDQIRMSIRPKNARLEEKTPCLFVKCMRKHLEILEIIKFGILLVGLYAGNLVLILGIFALYRSLSQNIH